MAPLYRARALAPWPSNGEVEGPDDHARQAPRAHTLSRDPRRQTDHASRPPPTIVRAHHDCCPALSPTNVKRVPQRTPTRQITRHEATHQSGIYRLYGATTAHKR